MQLQLERALQLELEVPVTVRLEGRQRVTDANIATMAGHRSRRRFCLVANKPIKGGQEVPKHGPNRTNIPTE